MGAADIIPGVSGGTIAFITGIYEDLIAAIRSINFMFIVYFFQGFYQKKYFKKSKECFRSIHLSFLITILFGIIIAFIFLANIIGSARELYPTYSASFFLGLILASAMVVYQTMVDQISLKIGVMGVVGGIVGFSVVGLNSIQTSHTLFIIFFVGIITICAMILPGISGAFILWLLGQYDFMLGVLRTTIKLDFSQFWYVVCYGFGGIIGLLLFSRFLSFLLQKYRLLTLAFLLGLMLGSLRKPAEIILDSPENIWITIVSSIIGVSLVGIIAYYNHILLKRGKTSGRKS